MNNRWQKNKNSKSLFLLAIFSITVLLIYGSKIFDQKTIPLEEVITIHGDTQEENNCNINKLDQIPEESMLIIGHAYGSHHGSAERNHAGIAPSVESLIQQNKQNIKTIIFTGDVFSVPSEKKWEALRRLTQPIPVYVAPGNHDVEITSDNAFRDIFRQRQSNQSKTYPQSFINGSTLFILDDSTLGDSSERLLHFILNEVERNPLFSKIIVARHHILARGLEWAQNGLSPSSYWSADEFQQITQKLNKNTDIIFIYGDGGAFAKLPRMACKSISGILNIVNGIGELPKDRVIVYSQGKLGYYPLGSDHKL